MMDSIGESAFWVGIGTLGAALISAIKTRHTLRREDRRDALKEYQDITERYREELSQLHGELARVTKLHEDCRVETARLEGEIKLLQATCRRLQSIIGDPAPATTVPVIVIASIDGIIRYISPSVASMLHYLPREITRQPISKLMPERYQAIHQAALKALQTTGMVPWTEKVILGHALTKDSREIPVAIALSAWQDEQGDWWVSAEIRQRQVENIDVRSQTREGS